MDLSKINLFGSYNVLVKMFLYLIIACALINELVCCLKNKETEDGINS